MTKRGRDVSCLRCLKDGHACDGHRPCMSCLTLGLADACSDPPQQPKAFSAPTPPTREPSAPQLLPLRSSDAPTIVTVAQLDPDASSFVTLRSSAIYNPLLDAAQAQEKKKKRNRKKKQDSDEDLEAPEDEDEVLESGSVDAASRKRQRAPAPSPAMRRRKAARGDGEPDRAGPAAAQLEDDTTEPPSTSAQIASPATEQTAGLSDSARTPVGSDSLWREASWSAPLPTIGLGDSFSGTAFPNLLSTSFPGTSSAAALGFSSTPLPLAGSPLPAFDLGQSLPALDLSLRPLGESSLPTYDQF